MASRDNKTKPKAAPVAATQPAPESAPSPDAPEPLLSLVPALPVPPAGSVRRHLPSTRKAITRVFRIPDRKDTGVVEEFQMYVSVGMYDDGAAGEIFIKADKAGSLLRGIFDVLGMTISLGLQHGVPLDAFTSKMKGTKFGPAGFLGSGDKDFKSCTSPFDLLSQWLEARFLPKPPE